LNRATANLNTRIYRILVVEDNLDSVHSLCLLLREMGHQVEYAINGYVALDAARRFKPDVAILDLGLPGMTGFEVCTQIRRDPELCATKLIALTGYGDESYRMRAEQSGFDRFFVKPLDPNVLYELLGDAKEKDARAPRL
jgi:DNA-binding response OmpR family regulator